MPWQHEKNHWIFFGVLAIVIVTLATVFMWRIKRVSDNGALMVIIDKECAVGDSTCLVKYIEEKTARNGPETALTLLEAAFSDGVLDRNVDDHQIAHRIGRKTAEAFGATGEAFLRCPTTFNYGCQHGFFEYVLGRSSSTKDAVDHLCGSFERDQTYSAKFKFYCYHGVGHGIMMAQAYDLHAGLADCDSLPTNLGREGCWQGLFMENVSAGMRGEARRGVFSKDDPLAPCDALEAQYRHECFINQAGYLMQFFKNNVAQASRACLAAPPENVDACLESIGLMTTNPSWQSSIAGDAKGAASEEIAREICTQFPEGYREQCIFGGVDNIMNFDELDIARADRFCALVDEHDRAACYRRIGISLRSQTTSDGVVREKCSALVTPFDRECLAGAGS